MYERTYLMCAAVREFAHAARVAEGFSCPAGLEIDPAGLGQNRTHARSARLGIGRCWQARQVSVVGGGSRGGAGEWLREIFKKLGPTCCEHVFYVIQLFYGRQWW